LQAENRQGLEASTVEGKQSPIDRAAGAGSAPAVVIDSALSSDDQSSSQLVLPQQKHELRAREEARSMKRKSKAVEDEFKKNNETPVEAKTAPKRRNTGGSPGEAMRRTRTRMPDRGITEEEDAALQQWRFEQMRLEGGPTARWGAGGACAAGNFFVFGGMDEEGKPLADAYSLSLEEKDPQWSKMRASMAHARAWLGSCAFKNSQGEDWLLGFGGQVSRPVRIW